MPKLSIVTINYNNRNGLKKTIDSVIAQTNKDFEWIVIDGGSNDGSKELIEQHSDHFSYWASEPDHGVYHAMNKGIAKATGKWMLFLNSGDCFCNNNVLEKAFTHPFVGDVMYGNAYYVNPDGSYRIKRDPDVIGISFFLKQTLCHQACFIRSSILKESLYNEDMRIAADIAKWLQLMVEGYQFVHLDEFIVNFDTTGIGSQSTKENILERKLVIEKYIPRHILTDAQRIAKEESKWDHISRRNSLRRMCSIFYHCTLLLDNALSRFERWRKK